MYKEEKATVVKENSDIELYLQDWICALLIWHPQVQLIF